MKTTCETGRWNATLLALVVLSAGLIGCSFLKPAKPSDRHFVLTPLPAAGPTPTGAGSLAVGLGKVQLPAYLFNTSLAVRKGTNEVDYLPSTFWAERLDTGFQRVLAANLAILLRSDRIQLSAWQKDEVAAELYVTLEQFDVDTSGKGVLTGRWRLLSPGGEKLLKAGSSRLLRPGPSPEANVAGAIATLSELLADFSRELAQSLNESAAAGPVPAVPK